MIDPWYHLAYDEPPDDAASNELKAWLRSNTQDSLTPVTPTTHTLPTLRGALRAAISEIVTNLDEQIAILVLESEPLNIQIKYSEYFSSRVDDWDRMNERVRDVDAMCAEECVELLWAAKEEIAWLVNEISRLECYIRAERAMERFGLRGRRTRLRPAARKWEVEREELVEEKLASLCGRIRDWGWRVR